MSTLNEPFVQLGGDSQQNNKTVADHIRETALSLITFQAVLIVIYGIWTKYPEPQAYGDFATYALYKDVAVMIFIGFGYLMTFLKKYGYGAVGFTFLLSAIVMEFGMLNVGLWGCVTGKNNFAGVVCDADQFYTKLNVNSGLLVQGLFAAAAAMISFGGVIGKLTVNQLTIMVISETMFYALNAHIYGDGIKALDVGGSVVIHTFGAYFGLACSYFITPKDKNRDFSDMSSCYHSDVFSFIGTIFLWIFWPSFNSVTAPPEYAERAVVNTVLALLSSCIMTFWLSVRVRGGVLDAVDIQNATLAGGVAMGTAAINPIHPTGALILGGVAGLLSTCGFRFLLPILEDKGIHDTCGIHNLHGMPGLLGGIAGIISMGASTKWMAYPHGDSQWLYQLFGLLITFAMAIVSGSLTGLFINMVTTPQAKHYTDETQWSIPTSELTFNADDIKDDIKRVAAARTVRNKSEWTKIRGAVMAIGRLRAAANHEDSTTRV